MKKLPFLCMLGLTLLAFSASTSLATLFTLDVKGESTGIMSSGGVAILYSDAMNNTWTSSGSGVIDPFLTVQANDIEKGMNTDAHPVPYDAKRGGNPADPDGFTRSLQYSGLYLSPFGIYDTYFNFSLDADQNDTETGRWILLTDFEVWKLPQAAGGFLSTYESLSGTYGGIQGQKMFDLTGDQIMIDYGVWAGSGNKLDMALLVPSFSGNPTDYIYVWTEFGIASTRRGGGPPTPIAGQTNDGPEEWITFGNATGQNGGKVPEPATLLLLGSGLVGALPFLRRKFKKL